MRETLRTFLIPTRKRGQAVVSVTAHFNTRISIYQKEIIS